MYTHKKRHSRGKKSSLSSRIILSFLLPKVLKYSAHSCAFTSHESHPSGHLFQHTYKDLTNEKCFYILFFRASQRNTPLVAQFQVAQELEHLPNYQQKVLALEKMECEWSFLYYTWLPPTASEFSIKNKH